MQQTPKPAAQFPCAEPLLEEHSEEVRQVLAININNGPKYVLYDYYHRLSSEVERMFKVNIRKKTLTQ